MLATSDLRLVAAPQPAPTPSSPPSRAPEPATLPSPRRADIQGLRAIAVLAVIAYHAGLDTPGGFAGVDVFFVISGFVITAMLHREWQRSGRIRFGLFYLRRVARLAPALALTVTVTALLASQLLPPLGSQQTAAKTAIGAVLLGANVVIAQTTGDYFAEPAASNPLLNIWSLSVEEQFYLFFPALLALCWFVSRFNRRQRFTVLVVGGLALVSFMLARWGHSLPRDSTGSSLLGFYSPIGRIWEFAGGALLALAATRVRAIPPRLAAACSAIGAGMLIVTFWRFDESMHFPSARTLVPVLGTMLLIAGGTVGVNRINRVLGTRPMVAIGDWSYSLYLWHWPLIVFALILWPFSPWAPFAAAALSFLPAYLSYRFVEEPLRKRDWGRPASRRVLIGTVLAVPMLAAAAMWTVASQYWLPRYESRQVAASFAGAIGDGPFYSYLNTTYERCESRAFLKQMAAARPGDFRCYQSRPGPADVVLLGDSNAEQLFAGVAEAAPNQTVAAYTVNGAAGLDDPQFRFALNEVVKMKSVRTVIVTSSWRSRGFPESLPAALSLLASKDRQVFVTDSIVYHRFNAFGCMYRRMPLLPPRCDAPVASPRAFMRKANRILGTATNAVPGTQLVQTSKYFCGSKVCSMVAGDTILYRSPGHLNIDGSRWLVQRMVNDNPAVAQALRRSVPRVQPVSAATRAARAKARAATRKPA